MTTTMTRVRSPGRIAAAAMRPMIDTVRSSGRDVGALLRDTGVDRSALEAPRWLSALLTDRVWTAAVARVGPDLPLRVASQVEPSSFGLLSYLLCCCETVGGAVTGLTKYYAVLSRATTFRLEVSARTAHLVMDQHGPRPPSVESFAVAVTLCFVRRQARAPIAVREVRLMQEHPGADLAAAHEQVLGARVVFGCSGPGWVLDRSALDVPLRGAEPGLHALLAEHAEQQLESPTCRTLAEKVRDQVAVRGAHCSVRATDVAADLGMSERTLRRTLRAEGTTFRDELDVVLAAIAAERLANEPVDDVAGALGFSEPAAFRRAFRRWHGAAPRAYADAARSYRLSLRED
jgi:AraC-like DNA-binding protein